MYPTREYHMGVLYTRVFNEDLAYKVYTWEG